MKSTDLRILRSLIFLEGFVWLMVLQSFYLFWFQVDIPLLELLTTGAEIAFVMILCSSVYFLLYGYKKCYYTGFYGFFFFVLMFIPLGSFYACKEIDTLIRGWK